MLEDAQVVAIEAAHAAGNILRSHLGHVREIRYKGRINLVTEVDRQSEQTIVEILRRRFPDFQVLAEEGTLGGQDPDHLWIIDPLDGTTNYAHGYPRFCVSIALEVRRQVAVGVVYDPVLDELFVATRGAGATLNGQPLRVSTTDQLIRSLLATGFPYEPSEMPASLDLWTRFITQAQALRRDGAAALNLCYVAAGRFDGFWERPLFEWDMAAAALIVEEAGGQLSDYQGGPADIYKRELVATNGRIHDEMLRVIVGDRG